VPQQTAQISPSRIPPPEKTKGIAYPACLAFSDVSG